MSRFFEYRGDCGKKSLLKTQLLRNIENGASASGVKKKVLGETKAAKPQRQLTYPVAPSSASHAWTYFRRLMK